MMRILVSLALIVAMALPAAAAPDPNVAGLQFKLTDSKGNPASAVIIAIVTKAASGLKPVNVATTDPQGAATVFLNTFANVSKKEKVQVQVRVCKDGKYTVILMEPGATLKKDENCDDKPAGFIPWGRGVRVTLNTTAATLTVSGGGGWLQNPLTYVGAGALTAGAIVAASSGGGSNNTTGASVTPGNANPPPPAPPTQSYAPFLRTFNITVVIITVNSVRACALLGNGGTGTLALNGNVTDGTGFSAKLQAFNFEATMPGTIAINGAYSGSAALGGGDTIDINGQVTVSGTNASTSGTMNVMALGGACMAKLGYNGSNQ